MKQTVCSRWASQSNSERFCTVYQRQGERERGREGGFDEVDSFFEMSFSEQLREILYSLPEGR